MRLSILERLILKYHVSDNLQQDIIVMRACVPFPASRVTDYCRLCPARQGRAQLLNYSCRVEQAHEPLSV